MTRTYLSLTLLIVLTSHSVLSHARPEFIVGTQFGIADVDYSGYDSSSSQGFRLGVAPHPNLEVQLRTLEFDKFELDNSLSAYIEADMLGVNLSAHTQSYKWFSAAVDLGYYRWKGEAFALNQKIGKERDNSYSLGISLYLQPLDFLRVGLSVDQLQDLFGESVRLGLLMVEFIY
ncbi:MAG TPA: hypothetical protein DCZ03_15810 [Gammaproteobacteria bacterium]|nr:hypothetical protein [Gammaproteobacteria bacterium]